MLWIVTEYLPIGRYLYAIGANPRAAALNGIRSRRFVIGAFVASGLLGAIAGVVLAARLRIGQASVGLEFLLPALVGAFLGSTTIKPGRVNVWGTIVGVAILAVGISGIQQIGGAFYVEPLFNGLTLLFAIGLAGYAQRRAKPVVAARAGAGEDGRHNGSVQGRNRTMRRTGLLAVLAVGASLAALSAGVAAADAVADAKAVVEALSKPNPPWEGPTAGPTAEAGKTIVYVSTDERNGGAPRRRRGRRGSGREDRLDLPAHRRPGLGRRRGRAGSSRRSPRSPT